MRFQAIEFVKRIKTQSVLIPFPDLNGFFFRGAIKNGEQQCRSPFWYMCCARKPDRFQGVDTLFPVLVYCEPVLAVGNFPGRHESEARAPR